MVNALKDRVTSQAVRLDGRGLALALDRSPSFRRILGIIAAVLGGIGPVSLVGAAVLWLTGNRAPAMEHRSAVRFVASVMACAFVAWSFLFSRGMRADDKAQYG